MKFNTKPFHKEAIINPITALLLKTPTRRYGSFRTFFGFLKPKPFIKSSIYNFLSILHLNPRPYTLVRFISLTKKYKPRTIENYLFKLTSSNHQYWASSLFQKLLFVKKNKFYRTHRFLLFKHKIFNYTTTKKLKFNLNVPQNAYYNDFRLDMSCKNRPYILRNLHTISTYNWKIII